MTRTDCLANWPDAEEGTYNPLCCRFPKSCSVPAAGEEALEARRDRQVALETVRDPADCPACRPGEQHEGHLQEIALRGKLDFIAGELADLETATLMLKHVEDLDTLLELHYEAEQLAAKAKTIAGGFGDRAWEQRGTVYGDHVHPLLGVVSLRRTAQSTKWDNETTATRVLDAHMEQLGGEVPDPAAVVSWVLEAGSVGYWRVGVLKDLGVDPDEEDLRWKQRGNPKIEYPSAPK